MSLPAAVGTKKLINEQIQRTTSKRFQTHFTLVSRPTRTRAAAEAKKQTGSSCSPILPLRTDFLLGCQISFQKKTPTFLCCQNKKKPFELTSLIDVSIFLTSTLQK